MQAYKLSFGTKSAKRPTYFNPEIDTLYFREYACIDDPICQRNQVGRVIAQLPDKDKIQKLVISVEHIIEGVCNDMPGVFQFPKLKEVTFVKLVYSDLEFPCCIRSSHYDDEPGVDFYWQRTKCDSSATPRGFSHFIDKEELIENDFNFHNGPCCTDYTFHKQTEDDLAEVENMIEYLKIGFWGQVEWNLPAFQFKGVSFDRIDPEKLFYNPWGNEIHNTRKKKARIAFEEGD
jgi:hypothetical protein